ncbi:MAG: Aspartyl/glutamyl-tRNA(Asn/Gln) amidotransferase subunit [Pseudomonadota bacterium]|jgi:aspartyl-tRNA(Asn)/glutamyl-tRNA(Gln) amidotransferase subunit B
MEFETVIGLEVHVQLSTKSKIFCNASAAYGGEPNEYIDPVTLGLPGALPVGNKRVVEYAIMMGLATHCEIRRFNRFARKHYFYPDLPKGYQISQFDEPICERGHIDFYMDGTKRTVGLKRIHMEEDAGKNLHDSRTSSSLVDLNRAGVPLLEVVSEPEIHSPAEAAAYLRAIRQLVRYLGVSDGNMEEGSLRCDANISLRPVGELKFGTRTEIKNLNSFKFVERALEYEIARQTAILKAGNQVVQQTLLFDSENGSTRPMRSKEESADYRYFPDPDLPPVVVEESWVQEVKGRLPRLPAEWATELVNEYGLSLYDATVLTSERAFVEFYHEVVATCGNAKAACNWVTSEFFGALNKAGLEIEQSPVSAQGLGELIKLVEDDVISGKMAKSVFEEMFETGKAPGAIVNEKGLKQLSNDDDILAVIRKEFDANPGQLAGYLGGNDRLHGFFVGQVMKATGGSANPKKVNDLIRQEAAARKGL